MESKNIRLTKKEQAFVSHKIKKLIDEGREHDQAVAIAYSMVREKRKGKK